MLDTKDMRLRAAQGDRGWVDRQWYLEVADTIDSLRAEVIATRRAALEEAALAVEDISSAGTDGIDIPTWGEGVSEGFCTAIVRAASAIRALLPHAPSPVGDEATDGKGGG